jgi:hypothetical protein
MKSSQTQNSAEIVPIILYNNLSVNVILSDQMGILLLG